MAEQDEEKKPFVVKDRRRFDASGNLRASEGDGRASKSPPPAAAPRAQQPQAQAQPPRAQQQQGQPPRAQAQQPQPQQPPRGQAQQPQQPGGEEWRSEWESAQQEAKDAMDAAAESYPRGPVGFAEFVLSIATNAVIHLGGDTKDGRVPPRVNLALAAQHIDIIAMIAEKTRGNLDREEQELLDSLLYDLRMKYVAVAQAQSQARGR